jgi:hypothetical protein
MICCFPLFSHTGQPLAYFTSAYRPSSYEDANYIVANVLAYRSRFKHGKIKDCGMKQSACMIEFTDIDGRNFC